jgi:transposase
VQDHISRLEVRIKEQIKITQSMRLVQILPGVGTVLAVVIVLEVGSVDRFSSSTHLTSYSGTVPKV